MNANVGMRYPVYAPVSAYVPGTSITYGNGGVIAEAVSASVNWNRADGRFYGDDVELDSDNGVLGYTISFEPSGLSDTARAALLGETLATSDYEINDSAAPDIGFGYIRVMRTKSGGTTVTKYEGWWFRKLKFAISSEETRTKNRASSGAYRHWKASARASAWTAAERSNSRCTAHLIRKQTRRPG